MDQHGPGEDEIRSVLQAERSTTAGRLASLTADFDQMVEAADTVNNDDEHDPEGATIAFERAQVSSLIDRARAHLVDLDRALDRLDMGTYGRCESCDQPIAAERLEAQPTARTCVACSSGTRGGGLRRR